MPRTSSQQPASSNLKDAIDADLPFGLRVLHRVFRPRRLLLIATALASLIIVPRLLDQLPDLSESEQYQLKTADIEITPPPGWVPHDLVDDVVQRSQLPPEISLLREGWAEQIAAAFAEHPWVEQVVQVRATGTRRVQVELTFREPVAMVEVQTGLYPISADSLLLPPNDFSIRDTSRYCLIRNVRTIPQGPSGQPWGDPIVAGAARLAEQLCRPSSGGDQSYWRLLDLQAIYVPRPTIANPDPEQLLYELETSRGSRIKWGRAPGIDHPGELSAAQKLGRLERYLKEVDDDRGPYVIDIRHWREITYQPILAQPDDTGRARR